MLGYCSSGFVTLLYGARHPDAPLRSMTNIAVPIDYSRWGLVTGLMKPGRFELDDVLDESGNVPPGALRAFFRLMQPTSDVKRQAAWLEHCWNDRYVATHRAMARWMTTTCRSRVDWRASCLRCGARTRSWKTESPSAASESAWATCACPT